MHRFLLNSRALASALATFSVIALFSTPAASAAENEQQSLTSKTALITLGKRQTSTVSVVAVGKERVPQKVVVAFFDVNDKRLAVHKGRVVKGAGAFVATLAHDDMPMLEPFLVRTEVKLAPVRATAANTTCPAAISMQNSNGPVIAWSGDSCSCGPSQGGGVFADCVGSGTPVIGQ